MELNLDDNPYQILELQEPFLEISEADIKKAFRKLALLKHPGMWEPLTPPSPPASLIYSLGLHVHRLLFHYLPIHR